MKSTSMRCLCCSSKEFVFVSRSLRILAINSCCCREESPSMTWCTSLFLYSHCLCVMDIKLLMNLAPHTAPIRTCGILPSTKQSHPRLSTTEATVIVRGVQGGAVLHRATALSEKVSLYHIRQILIDICVTKYVHDAFN